MQHPAAPAVVLDDSVAGMRWNDPRCPWVPLDRSTSLQYFEISPFCDINSNNNAARKQGLDPALDGVLSAMPAQTTEYALAERTEPHLFVVRKQQRELLAANMQKTNTHKYYYILGWQERHVYQAPTLQAVVNARMRRSMHFVREGFKKFKADMAPLPKVLREHMLEQEALQQQQLETLAAMDTDTAAAAGANGSEGTHKAAGAGGAGGQGRSALAAAAAAAAAAAKPVAVRETWTEDEQEHWMKTDNIIMSVLRRYPQPRLPRSKAEIEKERQEKQAVEAAAAAAAANEEKEAAEKKAAEEKAAAEAAAAEAAAAEEAAAALAAAAAAEAAAAAAQRGIKGKRQRPVSSESAPGAAAAGGGGGKAKRQRTPTPDPAAAAAISAPVQPQQQYMVQQQQQQQYMAQQQQQQQYMAQQQQQQQQQYTAQQQQQQMDPAMLAAQYNPSQHPLLQPQHALGGRPAAAAAAAPSASYGGGMSASMGGTAMTAGTAATASGMPGGRKIKLKFKKGLPGAGQQQPPPQ